MAIAKWFSRIRGSGGDSGDILTPSIMEERPPWASQKLPPCDVPGMITDEERRYYLWIGRYFSGAGEVVELGPWLGCSTLHIVEGLSRNRAFSGRKLIVYDDFVWRSSWMDPIYKVGDPPEHHADFRPLFEKYTESIRDRMEVETRRLALYDGNEEVAPLDWRERPVEIMYVDCGRSLEANEAWWQVFHSSFIPGRTLLIMQDWQVFKEEPVRWYNQTKEFTDSKGDSLRLIHELKIGGVGTFLYLGG